MERMTMMLLDKHTLAIVLGTWRLFLASGSMAHIGQCAKHLLKELVKHLQSSLHIPVHGRGTVATILVCKPSYLCFQVIRRPEDVVTNHSIEGCINAGI